jgi:EAL domain-containing protein (putative c-di-GMP-specific phosphodiesterase class I)
VVIPDQADTETITHVARRILETIKAPVEYGDSEISTACSIGVALYPRDGGDVESLMKHADAAMYKAKGSGRNRFQFYANEMDEEINGRLMVEGGLRRAIERNELFLDYQPFYDLKSDGISGIEALVRWRNSDMALVSPEVFIPWAEESDLILSIGAWVLRQACVQNKAWQEMGLPPVRISVNVSARQFRFPDFPETVAGILRETGLAPQFLSLELTERVIMNNVADVIDTMFKFAKMEVELSIDDFGTGYSSLSYLKQFPVSKLKIDKAFIKDIAAETGDATIAQAVISLGHSMGLKVIAEGVETLEQLRFLQSYQCDEVQGYLYSKPVDADGMQALLMRR